MTFTEVWTERACQTYETLVHFLQTHSSEMKTRDFINRVDEVLHFLRTNPELYESSSHRKEIRRCVVVPEVSLFYPLDAETIVLLTFWDNRGDPSKLSMEDAS